jgi:hypothetical protein
MRLISLFWGVFALWGCTKTSFVGDSGKPAPQANPEPPAPTEVERKPDVSAPAEPSGMKTNPTNQSWWFPSVTGQSVPQPAPGSQTAPVSQQKPVVVYKDPKLPDVIHLQAIRRNHDAWWKTCMYIQVVADGHTSQRIPLGCNKDTTPPTFVDLPAKKGVCNLIWLQAETTKQLDGTCGSKPCAYSHTPDFYISSVGSGYQKYLMFEGADVSSVMGYSGFNRIIHLTNDQRSDLSATVTAAKTAQSAGQNWARIYYEDQALANITKYVATGNWADSAWNALGVDYNDFVLDLVGDPGIPFKFTANVSQSISHFFAADKPPEQFSYRTSFCN